MIHLFFETIKSTQKTANDIVWDLLKYKIDLSNKQEVVWYLEDKYQNATITQNIQQNESGSFYNQIEDSFLYITAKNQTQGVGRCDRKWEGGTGNIFTSLVVKSSIFKNPSIATYYIAYSLYKAILDLTPTKTLMLKWPNDILIDCKKVCGILTHTISDKQNENTLSSYCIFGFGVNVFSVPIVSSAAFEPSCLAKYCNLEDFNQDVFLTAVVKNLQDCSQMSSGQIITELSDKYYNINKNISVKTKDDKVLTGIFIGLDSDGSILLKTNSNDVINITFGDVI